ncbi:hypothetical protein THARTR1_08086 [Trichoderma harzianum]|uniref:Uncharacterized protein n=1 Tax=Trichoderma harzianum TaxID=5544 RepID=A0A2K0U0H7_TRIHA|nr:hypothetical protein THARTR1_08086 [Trichoderma harzianum]
MSMSQPEGQEALVSKVTDIRPLPFEASEHSLDESSAQGGARKDDAAKHRVISDESTLRSSTTDSPQALEDVASPKSQGDADWMVFDKKAADSDKDAIENMSLGDFQMREETLEPAISTPLEELQSTRLEAQREKSLQTTHQEQPKPVIGSVPQDYHSRLRLLEEQNKIRHMARREQAEPATRSFPQDYHLQMRLLEKQNKRRLEMARQEQPEPATGSFPQDYYSQMRFLEEQNKIRLVMARQEQPEPATSSFPQDYYLQMSLLEEQNKRRLEMARQEQSKLNTPPPHLEAQTEQSSNMTRQEPPKPATSLAQQDYELQLKHLEAQNKKRLEMARQEQSKLNSQPPHTQMKMKGPPEPHVMAVMGPTQGNAAANSGNMMATLPPGARYFIPASRYSPANPAATDVKIMPNSGAQPVSQPNPEDQPMPML